EQEAIESGEGDDEETKSDGESKEEETKEQEEENGEDDGNGEEDQGLRISEEERMHEEDEADELYRDSPEAVSNISGIVHQYMHQEMMEAV
nr:hypothetical protein [Tanacetum cinerariifolium]